ncbi:hypothetical protein Tco_0538528 [Tanacetum coccineum]
MVNVIPPDHVDDVPVVEPNQHDDVPVVPEPVLVDEDEDPEEDEFEEEEDPQEEEDDMEVDIEEDENEPELTYPYEEVDPLNPPPPASESEPEDVIEDSDGLLPGLMRRDINSLFGRIASLSRQLCGRETAYTMVKKKGKEKDEYYGKLILDLGNEVRSSVEQGTAAMEKLVEKLGNTEDKVECKKLKNELDEARLSNTFLRMQNERVERDLYWTRFRAHEFYQEMIRRGFVFEERPNEAINVPIEDDKSLSSEPRGSPRSVKLLRWFKKTESVFRISECAEGKKVKFVAATLQGPALTWWNAKIATMGLETVNQMPWTEMKQLMTAEFNELALMCPRMVKPERVKVDAYIRGLTDNIKARDERILEGKKRKWESFQSGNSSGKGNHRDNSCQTLQNNQKQGGNARAMVTAPTDGNVSSGSLPLCECCFTSHVGPCTIKCHKYGKIGHKARYYKDKNVATGMNALPIPTC